MGAKQKENWIYGLLSRKLRNRYIDLYKIYYIVQRYHILKFETLTIT